MAKVDLKKDLKYFYTASPKAAALVEVPRLSYLMAQGTGDPNTAPAFQQAVETLFKLSYALKFMVKKGQGLDYGVMPLEGLWYADDPMAFVTGKKDDWKWTLMILQPEYVTRELVNQAVEQVGTKKGAPPLSEVRLGAFCEGLSAQILHVGPYAEEAPTVARLHALIKEKGYHFGGQHHEIYLSDARRTAPEKLKTIIRQPLTLEAQR